MIKKLLHISIFLLCMLGLSVTAVHAQSAPCKFAGGDIRNEFKKCNPSIGPIAEPGVDLTVTKNNSDFRAIVAAVIRRVQIFTSIIAIGVIVWIGLVLVLPVSSEAKENAKSKVFSVAIWFFVMIAATILVNAVINLLYEIFK